MTFLIVASFPDSVRAFRGALVAEVIARGVTVHVAVPGVPSGSESRLELESCGLIVHDIPLGRTKTNPLSDVYLLCRLVALMYEIRPAVVLAYTVKPVVYGSLAAWLVGVPRRFALISGLGYAFAGGSGSLLAWMVGRLYGFSLSKVHKVFFQNPDDQMLFYDRAILSSATPSLVVNGSGVDVVEYAAAVEPEGPACFLMIGRLLGDKGVREYVAAARQVRILHADTRFVLVGWIDENPDAISEAELHAWIAEGYIDFQGRLADVRPAIAACTVYVLPSYREGTPRTVLEAMAMGRPIITTDAPGCRETVVDGDNGILVPVRSVDGLVAAMLRFIEEPGLAQRMGARSRQIAEDKYDVRKVNDVMLREMAIDDPRIAEGSK